MHRAARPRAGPQLRPSAPPAVKNSIAVHEIRNGAVADFGQLVGAASGRFVEFFDIGEMRVHLWSALEQSVRERGKNVTYRSGMVNTLACTASGCGDCGAAFEKHCRDALEAAYASGEVPAAARPLAAAIGYAADLDCARRRRARRRAKRRSLPSFRLARRASANRCASTRWTVTRATVMPRNAAIAAT